MNAATVPKGMQKPKNPIAIPKFPFSNHWYNRIEAATTAIAPPTPRRNLESCNNRKVSEIEHNNELNRQINKPIVSSFLIPYLPVKRLPKIDIKRPGIATSNIRLLATMNPILNSCTIIGNNGGMACNVKIKENLVIKLTKSALDFPALTSFKRFHSHS